MSDKGFSFTDEGGNVVPLTMNDTHPVMREERMTDDEFEARYAAYVREVPQACPDRLMMHFIAERAHDLAQQREIARLRGIIEHAADVVTRMSNSGRQVDDDELATTAMGILQDLHQSTSETADAETDPLGPYTPAGIGWTPQRSDDDYKGR